MANYPSCSCFWWYSALSRCVCGFLCEARCHSGFAWWKAPGGGQQGQQPPRHPPPRPHSQQNNTHRFIPPTHGRAHKVGRCDSALNKQNSKALCTMSSEVTPTWDLQGVSFFWLSVQMLHSAEEMSAIMQKARPRFSVPPKKKKILLKKSNLFILD